MKRAKLCLVAAIAAVLAGACLLPATAAARGLGPCTLPVTHDPYEGFHIGVPNGWYLGRLNGMLVVSQNVAGTVEAVVEPVVLTRGLTAGHVFTSVSSTLKQEVAAGGSSISFRVTSRRGGLVQAVVHGAAGGTALTGQAGVAMVAHRTAHGSRLAVFYGYWAPGSQFRSERATLASIPACYGPQPGALLQIVRDQQFSYALPSGWTPSEHFNVLGVQDGSVAGAYYFFLEDATPSQGVTNAQTLLQYLFTSAGISVANTLYTVTGPSTTTVTGATSQAERTEFTGTLSGVGPLHGMATVNSVTGGGVTSGVVRLAISAPSLWNSLSGVLLEIAGGIQHSFVQDLQQIAQVSQQWQAFGQQVSGFDDALNGVDIVTDPLTGQNYMANYDAYDQEGPKGPGYYYGDDKLNIITPS
jgi:hypothetical protein